MKKILFAFALLICGNLAADAQVYRDQVSRTITTADTATVSNVRSAVVALQYTYTETSGTSAGKFYFEGSADGTGWVHIDSAFALTDVATVQTKWLAVTATSYASYRVRCSNTSSATAAIKFTVLRRPDDIR
ncbi:MAG: hypothetical protein ACT4OJ_14270 [Bacteroidota bacterium]